MLVSGIIVHYCYFCHHISLMLDSGVNVMYAKLGLIFYFCLFFISYFSYVGFQQNNLMLMLNNLIK